MPTDTRERLRERIKVRSQTAKQIRVDTNAPPSVVQAPIEVGYSKFIDVKDLPNLDELPFIPERMRDFAFRYATEYRTVSDWATEYNVSFGTIRKWLDHRGVKAYIALCRMEKRMYTLARRISLENMVYARLKEFLSVKITGDNAGAMARILEFTYKIVNEGGEGVSGAEKHSFGTQININQGTAIGNPYAQPERDVTPSPKRMEDIRQRFEQLELLKERRNGGEYDGNGSEGA